MDLYLRTDRDLTKKYRKNIRRKLIEGMQEFEMTAPGDRVLVRLKPDGQALLLAKCMQMIARYSDYPVSVDFCPAEQSDIYEKIGLPLTYENGDYDRIAEADCFDDICTATLENIFYKGVCATLPNNGGGIIRPLCYVRRRHIRAWSEEYGFGFIKKVSPADGLYAELTENIFDSDIRIFRTLTNVDMRFALGYTEGGVYHGYGE